MNERSLVVKYILFDILASALAWCTFFIYRKLYIEPLKYGYKVLLQFDLNFYIGLVVMPLFWITLYSLAGSYKNIYRRSRLTEFWQTLVLSLIGVLLIFFTVLLDDEIASYRSYYSTLFVLFLLHFSFTEICRFCLSSKVAHRIHNRIIGFNTLLIGGRNNAIDLYEELESQKKSTGTKFIGFVHVDEKEDNVLAVKLSHLGSYKETVSLIQEHSVVEVIIALGPSEHEKIGEIITKLKETNVKIKIIPDMYDIMAGSVKMNSIFGAPLIEINPDIMPDWQKSIKRLFDLVCSLIFLLVLSPLYLVAAIGVKLSSKGPAIYSHDRIGKYGKPFKIYKFRSMYVGAEEKGPSLSSKNDKRITPFGRFMRQVRLDEIPQFYNVLIGDMSIVGPRPERQYFINQIVKYAPHYTHLHKVTPGITSWGQVKFGYAENVEQMVQRLKYDMLYIENMSLLLDFKILIYTILIVIQGRGK